MLAKVHREYPTRECTLGLHPKSISAAPKGQQMNVMPSVGDAYDNS
jgi:hypothetical protein